MVTPSETPEDQFDSSLITRPTRHDLRRSPVRIAHVSHFIFTHALSRVWIIAFLSGVYALVPIFYPDLLHIGVALEALLTLAVGLMLSVRVSKAYDRWWEARMQWGKLVNISRNLVIKLNCYVTLSDQERSELHRLVQGFARATKNHLRGNAVIQDVRGFNRDDASPQHVPAHIASRIYALLEGLSTAGRLSETRALIVDSEARELMEVVGACERIHNTPMSPSFPAFVRFSIVLAILTTPWELAERIGWLAVPSMVVATFLLVGGESIAHFLERPFGLHTDDLDLESYCDGIDRVTAEVLTVPSRVRDSAG